MGKSLHHFMDPFVVYIVKEFISTNMYLHYLLLSQCQILSNFLYYLHTVIVGKHTQIETDDTYQLV